MIWTTRLLVLAVVILCFTNKNRVAEGVKTWPSGNVPYHINSNMGYAVQLKILAAMKAIEDSVNSPQSSCINFIKRTMHYNYIDIYSGVGCHSSVGMSNYGRQGVSIGPGCEFKGIMMHELLHALGFFHEHSRYDRDANVAIDFRNIQTNHNDNFALKGPQELNPLSTPYDLDSIMSYDPYTLAADTSRPVLVPKAGKASGVFRMGQRMSLSKQDVLRIQRQYGCQEDTSHIVHPEQTNNVLSCNFYASTCGLVDGGGNFKWQVKSGPSAAGPGNGHSFGNDNYIVATANGNSGKTAMFNTPVINKGAVCIDFFLFLKDRTSMFKLEAFGPDFMTTPLPFQASATGYNQWVRYQSFMNLPPGVDYQITFKAVMGSSDVAVDDVQIYTGACN